MNLHAWQSKRTLERETELSESTVYKILRLIQDEKQETMF